MPRHKLEPDSPESDFLLFGICSQSKDYRLAWILNNNLHIMLKRDSDRMEEVSSFSVFTCVDAVNQVKYNLLSNKKEEHVLVKEFKQMDFFLMASGNHASIDPVSLLRQVRRSESVLGAYKLDPGLIKSKQYFLSE